MHLDAGTILQLGGAIFASGSLGLFLVRLTNARLRGLGWLAGCFASGFIATVLMLTHFVPRGAGIIGADLAVLLAFALLHVGVMELMTQRHLLTWTSMAMLTVMLGVDLLYLHGSPFTFDIRVVALSVLVAIECSLSARLLWGAARRAERHPALFCCTVLSLFAGFNLFRAFIVATGLASRMHWEGIVYTGAFALYIGVALGLEFGFFWMSTAQLSLQLEHMAGTDPLTRLYNRRTFIKACEKELEVAHRKQRPFSILMVDLDHFKSINDRYGHAVGDAALLAAVHSMQNSIRGSDVLARWGGEEFAALLPNANLEAAHVVAERLRANVERVQLPVPGPEGETVVRMTVSIGLATCDDSDTIQTVMTRADKHLYRAKDSGRNRVQSAALSATQALLISLLQ